MGNCHNRDDFSQLIYDLRVAKNVSPAALCNKICSESLFRKIENGDRQATATVKARLLKRLGEASDKFDRFLNNAEYRRWTSRQKIIDAILKKDASCANNLITEYKSGFSMADVVEKQFILLAEAETAALSGTPEPQLCLLYEKARDLTITVDENGVPTSALLSPIEFLLVLDCARFYSPEQKQKIFSFIRDITQSNSRSDVELCLFAPKSLNMFITYSINQGNLDKDAILHLLRISKFAINKLISSGRLYYVKQLLRQQAILYSLLDDTEYGAEVAEIEEFINMLSRLEEITSTSLNPPPSIFFFSDRTVVSLPSVIHRRRLMLGMSLDELCENICDRKTLCRVESMKTNIHEEIALELLNRLNLQKNLQYHSLSTLNTTATPPEREIFQACHEKNYIKALEFLNKMEETSDKKDITTVQFYKRHRAILNLRAEKITTKEYVNELLESLALTIPAERLALKDVYITREEQSTIFNLLTVSGNPYAEAIFIMEKNRLETERKQIGLAFDSREYDAVILGLLYSTARSSDYKLASVLSLDLLKNGYQNQRNMQIVNGLHYLKDSLENLPEADRPFDVSLSELQHLCEVAEKHFNITLLIY